MTGARLLTSTLKSLAVLEAIADSPDPIGISELARARGTGRGTVHQQVATLVQAGWVEQTADSRYRLSLRCTRIGHRALEQVKLGTRIRPVLEALAASTSEAVSVAVLDDTEALIIQRVESEQVLRADLGVGTRMPLATSASGRVLVAYSDPQVVEALRLRRVALPSEEEVARVRAEGHATSPREYIDDIFAAAAPVFDVAGSLLAALSTAGPAWRFNAAAALQPLRAAADEINFMLSGRT